VKCNVAIVSSGFENVGCCLRFGLWLLTTMRQLGIVFLFEDENDEMDWLCLSYEYIFIFFGNMKSYVIC